MENYIKTQIITASSARELNAKIQKYQEEGFSTVGSHQVVVKHSQNRFAGSQHRDTINELEYSITISL